MRIITGKYRGRSLFTVPGRTTRPTSSFNREMIFSMHPDYEGKQVLDLFAGTGSFGLETLSRGAQWVDFVEFSTAALAVLMQNIAKLDCGDCCHVWRKRCEAFLKKPPRAYDVIFLDPPYAKGLVNPTLEAIFRGGALADGGIVIAEHSPKEPLSASFMAMRVAGKDGRENCFSILSPAETAAGGNKCAQSEEFD